jgi:predicted nucleic acid-binding protein
MNGVVIATNVFVAAGFNIRSAAARIVAAVQERHFQLVWNKPTRRETETILRRISGLEWVRVAPLFRPEGEFAGPVDPDAFVMIADRDDRKFTALAAATKTPLLTNDSHVLTQQRTVGIEILSPRALVTREELHIL